MLHIKPGNKLMRRMSSTEVQTEYQNLVSEIREQQEEFLQNLKLILEPKATTE